MSEDNGYMTKKAAKTFLSILVTILVFAFGLVSSELNSLSQDVNTNRAQVSGMESQLKAVDNRTERIEAKLDKLIYDSR